MKKTKIFLNTWGAYNDGSIGYGWMTPSEARDFIDKDKERDGGEFFIADIDNYLGMKFSNLEYCNINNVIETIETLENLEQYDRDCVVALMEHDLYLDIFTAIESLDEYIFYEDKEAYYNMCDEAVEEEINNYNGLLSQYFDYEAYHFNCDFNIFEASNGICILK